MMTLPQRAVMFSAVGALLIVAAPRVAWAQDGLDTGDTSWMLTSSVLVLFMTIPGLSLFYAGLVRSKNVLSVMMQCFAITCLVTVLWTLYAYGLAFGDGGGLNRFVGLGKLVLSGVTRDTLSGTIPETVFQMFQLTFAIITPALSRGRVCRAAEILRHDVVHGALGDRRVCTHCALGLGRRVAG